MDLSIGVGLTYYCDIPGLARTVLEECGDGNFCYGSFNQPVLDMMQRAIVAALEFADAHYAERGFPPADPLGDRRLPDGSQAQRITKPPVI